MKQAARGRYYDISTDDRVVVDAQGTVWVYQKAIDAWRYLTDDDGQMSWDHHRDLPGDYEPYQALEELAADMILKHVNWRL